MGRGYSPTPLAAATPTADSFVAVVALGPLLLLVAEIGGVGRFSWRPGSIVLRRLPLPCDCEWLCEWDCDAAAGSFIVTCAAAAAVLLLGLCRTFCLAFAAAAFVVELLPADSVTG